MSALVFWSPSTITDADRQLAERLGLPIVERQLNSGLYLTRCENCLMLGRFASPEKPVSVDFASSVYSTRQQRGRELLVKAVGGGAQRPAVLDATAGLGRDSFILASHGYPVTLVEREPVLMALLEDAVLRAQSDPGLSSIVARMQFQFGDAVQYLQAVQEADCPDVIYLDPMFAGGGKSARVKKDLRLLQDLLPEKDDGQELLEQALERSRFRVVVKRAIKAAPLAGRQASFSIKGKAIRFDVYALRSLDKRD